MGIQSISGTLTCWCLLFVSVGVPLVPALVYENDPKELLNWCIDARHHKSHPGPTDGLHQQCKSWERRSCCTKETTVAAHTTNMYSFNWDHCSHVKPLSPACRRHFVQDLCFYECSPNTGPWVVKVNGSKIRKERYYHVPLCASECNRWFADCVDDFTCTDNWVRNFDWRTGTNKCFSGTSCRSYRDVFGTAQKFCETVWDDSWKVTPDTEPCMHLWFDGSKGNPNDAVAQRRLEWLIKTHRLGDLASVMTEAASGAVQLVTTMIILLSLVVATINIR